MQLTNVVAVVQPNTWSTSLVKELLYIVLKWQTSSTKRQSLLSNSPAIKTMPSQNKNPTA